MRKALFILMLVVVGVIVAALIPSRPQPIWRPKTQIVFLGFTNLVAGTPAADAWFVVRDYPPGQVRWDVVEVSEQEGGKWKRWEPWSARSPFWFHWVSDDADLMGCIPMQTTNAPFRVVFEMEQMLRGVNIPPAGNVGQFFWNLRLRWRRVLHPGSPREWLPRGPLFYLTNEFNFAAGTNAVVGR